MGASADPYIDLDSDLVFLDTSTTPTKLSRKTLARLLQKDQSAGDMGKSEIESWIASTSYADDSEVNGAPGLPEWRRESILSDWPSALQAAQKRLLTSSTKVRQQFLKEELLFIAKHGGA